MVTDNLDIIGQIKSAEAKAKELVALAEEESRRAVAETEAAVTKRLSQLKQQLDEEFESVFRNAEIEARRLLEESVADGQRQAAAMVNSIPEEKMRRAIALLVEKIKVRWQ